MGLLNIFDKKIKLDKVLICVGTKEYGNEIFKVPFIDDLVLYFVENNKEGFRVVSNEYFEKMNISVDELIKVAKENTKKKIYSTYNGVPLRVNEEDQVVFPYDDDVIVENGNYNFWTSLVLFDEFWDKNSEFCLEKNWDRYYIAMPYRTFLLIGNADNEKSKQEILNQLEEYKNQDKEELVGSGDFEAGRRVISNDLFIMENGKLTKVK